MTPRSHSTIPAIVLGTVLLLTALSGCTPAPAAPPATSASPTATTAESPSPEATAAPEVLSDADYENIAAAISTGNTQALESYLAEPVNFILAASECCGPISSGEVITNLEYLNSAIGPWTWPVEEATLDVYRTGFYVDYFPEGAFVMQSADSDPYVVAFATEGRTITGIFIAGGASILTL